MVESQEYRVAELRWYRTNGKYGDRIRAARDGIEYVVGDWSWNRRNPDRIEYIEKEMEHQLEAISPLKN